MRSFILALALAAAAHAACPNGCSGNGECGSNDVCACYENYVGNDCSERMCPHGLAWADAPAGDLNHDGTVTIRGPDSNVQNGFATSANRRSYLIDEAYGVVLSQFSNKLVPEYFPVYSGTNGFIIGQDSKPVGGYKAKADEAHFYTECSGRGVCERSSATCSCFGGYTGSACQRSVCPNDCSGNGVCMTAREIADGSRFSRTPTTKGRNYRATSFYNTYTTYTGINKRFDYNHWDADKAQACVCDAGYAGADCSLRTCPRGRDPLVTAKSQCGNAVCAPEVQALYIKLKTAHASTPSPVTIRFGYTDVYGADSTRTLFSKPLTLDSGLTAFSYQQQVAKTMATFPNNVLGGVNVTVSAVEDGTTTAKVDTIYPHMQALSDANDIIEFKLDFNQGPQGNVNGVSVHYVSGSVTDWAYGSVQADTSGARASVTGTSALTPALGAFFTTVGDQITPTNGNTPFTECSNRGTCDYSSGQCECFAGYFGTNCAQQNALAA